jgi:hypothetical protein
MRRLLALGLCLLVLVSVPARAHEEPATQPTDRPTIDVVFCIDCSGSMGGVIETAKQKVWAIVNEVAKAKPAPVLRIGLYGYGNGEGPFRKFELTDDLDEVYKNLMTFKDEGWGSEYVGLVIHRATDEMNWATGKQVLKVIYVVGNETARQGPEQFDYSKTAPAAIAKDIVVNAIYCGNTDYQNATPTWMEIARLADGQYMEIAGEGGGIVLATPFDPELATLNARLNATYLGYGARAETGAANQLAQDSNAAGLGGAVLAERAMAKSAAQYQNAGWDLVDAVKQADFDFAKLKDEELPKELRDLPADQRRAFVDAKARERDDVRKQIQDLATQRNAFVAEEIKKQGLKGDAAFEEAVKKSIVQQAEKKGFTFDGGR